LQLREVAGEQLRVHLEGCRGEHVGGQRQIKTSEGLPLTAGGTHKGTRSSAVLQREVASSGSFDADPKVAARTLVTE
jgi:hypothetical protein